MKYGMVLVDGGGKILPRSAEAENKRGEQNSPFFVALLRVAHIYQ